MASPAVYLQHEQIKEGNTGTLIKQKTYEYTARTPAGGHTVQLISKRSVYRDDAGTQKIDTSYAFTFFTDVYRVLQVEITQPVISTGQNGDGATYKTTQRFDGRVRHERRRGPCPAGRRAGAQRRCAGQRDPLQ